MIVCFGDFEFDRDARTLRRVGQPVHLTPRAFSLLRALVERRPRPLPRAELVRRLWPDTFVSEGNLANVVLELRRALHDKRPSKLVKTVHRMGYAFAGETSKAAPQAARRLGRFAVYLGGREIGLDEGENWIGRSRECRVQVHCSKVSRRHARITTAGGKAILEDSGSRNGTFLCGERLEGPARMKRGDWIKVGSVYLGFSVVYPDVPTDAD